MNSLSITSAFVISLIKESGFFSKDQVQQESSWIPAILNLPKERQIVVLNDAQHERHLFNVAINQFEADTYIITLSDISITLTEKLYLEDRIIHDPLTNALNREYLNRMFIHLKKEYLSHNEQMGIVMFDIDHFKAVNDTYGHDMGDTVLKELVKVVQHFIRDNDKLIRYGGEEFIILLSSNAIEHTLKMAQHLCNAIANHNFSTPHPITCSFGVTHCIESDVEMNSTIKRADNALYQAKEAGRNQVAIQKS
jgi:diguanylate cyclase (GGDEF)-like protein